MRMRPSVAKLEPNLTEVESLNLEQIVRAGHRIDEIIASTRAMFR